MGAKSLFRLLYEYELINTISSLYGLNFVYEKHKYTCILDIEMTPVSYIVTTVAVDNLSQWVKVAVAMILTYFPWIHWSEHKKKVTFLLLAHFTCSLIIIMYSKFKPAQYSFMQHQQPTFQYSGAFTIHECYQQIVFIIMVLEMTSSPKMSHCSVIWLDTSRRSHLTTNILSSERSDWVPERYCQITGCLRF